MCIHAAEELQFNDSSYLKSNSLHVTAEQTSDLSDMAEALTQCGLSDLDLDSCEVSDGCKKEMCKLVMKYSDIFSKHRLDCSDMRWYEHKTWLAGCESAILQHLKHLFHSRHHRMEKYRNHRHASSFLIGEET